MARLPDPPFARRRSSRARPDRRVRGRGRRRRRCPAARDRGPEDSSCRRPTPNSRSGRRTARGSRTASRPTGGAAGRTARSGSTLPAPAGTRVGSIQVRTGRSTSRSTAGPPISTRSTSRPAHARSCRPPSTRLVGSGVPASRTRSTCSRATRERRRRCSCTTAAPRRSRSSSATTSRRSPPRRGESGTRRGPSVVPPTAGPSCETRGPIEPGGSLPSTGRAVRADRRRRRCPGLLRAVGAGAAPRSGSCACRSRISGRPRVDRDLPSRHRRRVPAVGGGSTRSAGPVVLALPVRPRTG